MEEILNFLIKKLKIIQKQFGKRTKIQGTMYANVIIIRNTIQIIRKKSWTFREHIHIILSMHFLCQVKISKKFGAQTVIELSIYAMRA